MRNRPRTTPRIHSNNPLSFRSVPPPSRDGVLTPAPQINKPGRWRRRTAAGISIARQAARAGCSSKQSTRLAKLRSMASPPIKRALISVSNKLGLGQFARGLDTAGVELFSTGGTRRHLEAEGLTVRDVAE